MIRLVDIKVTLVIETNKGNERRTLEMWEDESAAEFAERVRETIVDLTETVLS
jgi:hypothetical protein